MGEVLEPKPVKPTNPNSAAGILAAGNRAPATIAAAAAVVAIGTMQGKDKADRKSLQSAGKLSKDEEWIAKRDALKVEWFKWKSIHAEDIAKGDPPVDDHLDNLDRTKRAYVSFCKTGWKTVDTDQGKNMVEAAEAFFKANEEVELCMARRAYHAR